MPRSCACERLFRRLEEDVRLRCAPLAAQMLWLKLARLALAAPEPGVLRVGLDLGFLGSVSVAVSASETETGTHLETLRKRGLVEADEAEGVLRLPDLAEQAARSNAARINGLRGGRPRRGETREEAAARRQGHLMLPLAKPRETEPESSRAASLASSVEEKPSQAAREGTDWVALGTELAELAGLDPARGGYSLQVVRGWLAMGASPALLREVVGRVGARARDVRSLSYFTAAVREALERAETPAAVPEGETYSDRLLAWHLAGGEGPPPESPYRRSAA